MGTLEQRSRLRLGPNAPAARTALVLRRAVPLSNGLRCPLVRRSWYGSAAARERPPKARPQPVPYSRRNGYAWV